MMEIWKDIENYEGLYQVSNLGNVKSLPRKGAKGGILSPTKVSGYLRVGLSKDGKRKFFLIHRLVAEAFLPNEEELSEVDHLNGNRTDNRLENLQWLSKVENNRKRESGVMIPRKIICVETEEIFESVAAAAKSVNRSRGTM